VFWQWANRGRGYISRSYLPFLLAFVCDKWPKPYTLSRESIHIGQICDTLYTHQVVHFQKSLRSDRIWRGKWVLVSYFLHKSNEMYIQPLNVPHYRNFWCIYMGGMSISSGQSRALDVGKPDVLPCNFHRWKHVKLPAFIWFQSPWFCSMVFSGTPSH
jgi:hypothetical protein